MPQSFELQIVSVIGPKVWIDNPETCLGLTFQSCLQSYFISRSKFIWLLGGNSANECSFLNTLESVLLHIYDLVKEKNESNTERIFFSANIYLVFPDSKTHERKVSIFLAGKL